MLYQVTALNFLISWPRLREGCLVSKFYRKNRNQVAATSSVHSLILPNYPLLLVRKIRHHSLGVLQPSCLLGSSYHLHPSLSSQCQSLPSYGLFFNSKTYSSKICCSLPSWKQTLSSLPLAIALLHVLSQSLSFPLPRPLSLQANFSSVIYTCCHNFLTSHSLAHFNQPLPSLEGLLVSHQGPPCCPIWWSILNLHLTWSLPSFATVVPVLQW